MNARLLIAGFLFAAAGFANAASTALCSGTAGNSATVTAATDGSSFVKESFTIKCSNNTQVNFDQDAAKIVVCANSKKGKNNYGGGSELGGVKKVAACTVASGLCSAKAADLSTTTGCAA